MDGQVLFSVTKTVDWLGANGFAIGAAALVMLGTYLALTSTLAKRVWTAAEDTMFANWRLALLGTTGIVLSLASGYTTWDGMRNFTGDGVLSAMITFGIQGVMLIVAWLIGESFATGMNRNAMKRQPSGFSKGAQGALGALIGVMLFVAVMVLVMQSTGQVDVRRATTSAASWSQWADKALIIAVGLLLACLVALYSASDLVRPYLQSSRVIIRNAVLWVMFLACMGTSVFFSFDSLFSAIFPQSERVRAAELRAQNQVAGIVADIGGTISNRRLTAAEDLFTSDGWRAYDTQLGSLAREAQTSTAEIQKYFDKQLEDRNSAVRQQQERIVTAQSGAVGLQSKKISLTDEVARLKAERPQLAADYAEKKNALDERAKEVDAKRVEAMAEEKGVEGTGKVGKGQVYRQRMEELGKLQDYIKIGEERVRDSKKRLDQAETRIAQIERELAAIDGDLAKLRGESETAEQRIKLAQEQLPSDQTTRIDPARMLPAFENARAEFRQDPTAKRLANVQQLCGQIYTAMIATPATKSKVAAIDCDPKHAAEAASLVFALNDGADVFGKGCAGGDKLAAHKTTDDLFGFARKCLADSGLPSKETDELRTRINFIELNRDDKAHRFVVTWNAFNDGNRLAYLALAIAIAIDSLVFMSGLFGANAVRSPLSDVPSFKARSAQQLEAIIENALLPDKFENARTTLQSMRPITNAAGFMAEVRMDRLDPVAMDKVLPVLNAGTTIHAVEYDDEKDRYLVRAELFEFLSIVAKKSFEADKKHADLAELEKIVSVALLPDVGTASRSVLSYIHPMSEDRGFTGEIRLSEVTEADKRLVRSTLNAGATLQRVQRVGTDVGHYYVHKDLYKTLARIAARSMGSTLPQIGGPGSAGGLRDGGSLDGDRPALPPVQSGGQRQLTSAAPQQEPAATPVAQPGSLDRLTTYRLKYVSDLIGAFGLDADSYLDLSGDAFGAAVFASEQFSRARQGNSLLDQGLTERDEKAQMKVEEMFSFLEGQLQPGDADLRRILKDAYDEVQQNWAVLMLLPNGPYETVLLELIEALEPENGAGVLKAEHAELLRAAKRLRQSLLGSPRDNAESWRKLAASLQYAQHGSGGHGQHTLN
jgi:hypothetical protein